MRFSSSKFEAADNLLPRRIMSKTSIIVLLKHNETMNKNSTSNTPADLPILVSTNYDDRHGCKLKERYIPHVRIKDASELHHVYEFGEKIGEGGFGIVLSVTDRNSSKKWAMKCVAKTKAGDSLKLLRREIQILKLINHPHIIYLDRIYETSQKMYMIFEKCHGTLSEFYKSNKPFNEIIARKITKELVEAVAYLHKYDIVHRDLKLENILLGDNPRDTRDEYYVKLTDFGLSIFKFGKGIDSMLHEFCGTLTYMSPEMITSRSYSQQCDNWAIGVIIYLMVVGDYPFYSKFEKELQKQICNNEPQFADTSISTECIDLVRSLLIKNPANRLTAAEVLQHPWMLNKSMPQGVTSNNILQMMKEWKSEMTVPGVDTSFNLMSPETDPIESNSTIKQPLPLAKTEIKFDRSAKGGSSKQRTTLCYGGAFTQRNMVAGQMSRGDKQQL